MVIGEGLIVGVMKKKRKYMIEAFHSLLIDEIHVMDFLSYDVLVEKKMKCFQ